MDKDSTQDAQLPGSSSIPIRAPLTIDSDPEFYLSSNEHIYSRTSSFNSSSNSIDFSSYSDEHSRVLEEENDGFETHPDDEIVIERSCVEEFSFRRPFVKYPGGNYVKEGSDFDKFDIFRPFVKTPFQESSSDRGIKVGVPVAHLTSDCDCDCDCDSDSDSVDGGHRLLDSGEIPADEIVQKVRIFGGGDEGEDEVDDELQIEGLFCGDDKDSVSAKSIENDDELQVEGSFCVNDKDSVSAKSIENYDQKVECLNEVVKLSESNELIVVSERIDEQIVSVSKNEIEIETINESEQEIVFDCCKHDYKVECWNELNEVVVDLERIDEQIVSDSNNEIEIETINESEQELVFDIYRNEKEEIPVKTINESEQEIVFDGYRNEKEEETPVKKQPIRSNFQKLVSLLGLSNKDLFVGRQNDEFDFHLTILVIGKTGVGKSATINSIFGENKSLTNAFDPCTTTIQEIIGNVDGVKLRVIDTPGLKCAPSERSYNLRILSSIKRFVKKHAPDVVLYVDRLDMFTRDVNDSRLLRLITSSLGSSVWCNCIIALTHANSNLLDESSGGFVFQRRRFLQEQIVSHGGSNQQMVNPVWLVENHPSYKHECIDLNEDECDQVAPFKPLNESLNGAKCSLERRNACSNDYGYRVKLLGNKHWSLGCRLYAPHAKYDC